MSNSFRIRYHPRARRLKLRVHRDESLEVVAPPGTDEQSIRRFVASSGDWVEKARVRARADRTTGPESGPFPQVLALRALGRLASVDYVDTESRFCRWNGEGLTIGLTEREPAAAHSALVQALKARAVEDLEPRFRATAGRHSKRFGRLTWRNQKTRWGSCSSSGNISLNIRLLFLPPQVVDYVFAHELAHLDHPDHSPRFWNALEVMLPGAHEQRRAIRSADQWLPEWILR